jgi:hypothetical protein
MQGAISPLPQYAIMALFSVKEKAQEKLYLYLWVFTQDNHRSDELSGTWS